jgi:hypothetical protein
MTVRDLYNWCKACRHKDAEVYLVKDWEEVDEEGCLTDLYRLRDISTQIVIVDEGMDYRDVYEVLLDFDTEKAHAEIRRDY